MKALLFDMDGVLVDVSCSYRKAVQKAVECFSQRPITPSEIQGYKNRGGLNNDWDLTCAILQERGISQDRSAVIDVFQKLYLGRDFDGLISQERWLLSPDTLSELRAAFSLGIVTGRPRNEAEYVLKRFRTEPFFSSLICLEDVPKGKGKPDPYGIQLALDGWKLDQGYYLGDTVDDMRAARSAGLVPVGVIAPGIEKKDRPRQRKILRAAGARMVLHDINDLKEVLI
jgi:HAD superfamily phosphatase